VRANERTVRVVVAVACIVTLACERRSGGDPWVIPGPTVPGVVLREPFVWDTREELMAWTDNAVTRGPIRIDTNGSNGAIAIDFVAGRYMLLRSPNLEPPLPRVRAVCIRYMWAPSSARQVGTLAVRFDAANSPRVDLQLRGSADLRPASTWTETELRVPSYVSMYTPLDVNYVYFEGDSASDTEGVLKIDSIALMTE
jgi:hypothetical protein